MKIIILCLFAVINIPNVSFADYVNPPDGPYRSLGEFNGFVSSVAELSDKKTNIRGSGEPVSTQINSSDASNLNKDQTAKTTINNAQDLRTNNRAALLNKQLSQQPQQRGEQHYDQQEAPPWVKQRQYEMQQRMQQFHARQQAYLENLNKSQAWNRNQPAQVEVKNTEAETGLYNQTQQHYPAARGQVYGPESIPPAYYMQHAEPRQPVFQERRFTSQYSPGWR